MTTICVLKIVSLVPSYFILFFVWLHFSHRQCRYNNISKNNIILPWPSDPILEDVKQLFQRPDNNNTSTVPLLLFRRKLDPKENVFFLSIFDDAHRAVHLHRTSHVCIYGESACTPNLASTFWSQIEKPISWLPSTSSLGEQLHCRWSKENGRRNPSI